MLAVVFVASGCSEYSDIGVQRDEAGRLTILSGCEGGGLSEVSVRVVGDPAGPARFRAELRGADADRFPLSEPLEGWLVEGSADDLPTDEELRVFVFERYVASGGIRFVPDELVPGAWYWDDPTTAGEELTPIDEDDLIAARAACSDPAVETIHFFGRLFVVMAVALSPVVLGLLLWIRRRYPSPSGAAG